MSGVMTVAVPDNDPAARGFKTGSDAFGHMWPRTFLTGPDAPREITGITVKSDSLAVSVDKHLAPGTIITIGARSFDVNDAVFNYGDRTYTWVITGGELPSGATVGVEVANTPRVNDPDVEPRGTQIWSTPILVGTHVGSDNIHISIGYGRTLPGSALWPNTVTIDGAPHTIYRILLHTTQGSDTGKMVFLTSDRTPLPEGITLRVDGKNYRIRDADRDNPFKADEWPMSALSPWYTDQNIQASIYVFEHDPEPDAQRVWSETMTVGAATNGDEVTTGYDRATSTGALDSNTATHDGVTYTVEAIKQVKELDGQGETKATTIQVTVDAELPRHAIVRVDGQNFLVRHGEYDPQTNTHSWETTEDTAWNDGNLVDVALYVVASQPEPTGEIIWSAEMTTGTFESPIHTHKGFNEGTNNPSGSMTPAMFTHDGTTYTITNLMEASQRGPFPHGPLLQIIADQPLPNDAILRVDGRNYRLSQGETANNGYRYKWEDIPTFNWIDGETVQVTLHIKSVDPTPTGVQIWSTTMTVGAESAESTQDSCFGSSHGRMDSTSFEYLGTTYTVTALLEREETLNGETQHSLRLHTTHLPDDVVVRIDGTNFAVSDADKSGLGEHVWTEIEDLRWDKGSTLEVTLHAPVPEPPYRTVWSSNVTVQEGKVGGEFGGTNILGFHADLPGSSPANTTFADQQCLGYNVTGIYVGHHADHDRLFIIVDGDQSVLSGAVLYIGDQRFNFADASFFNLGFPGYIWKNSAPPTWTAGDNVRMRIQFERHSNPAPTPPAQTVWASHMGITTAQTNGQIKSGYHPTDLLHSALEQRSFSASGIGNAEITHIVETEALANGQIASRTLRIGTDIDLGDATFYLGGKAFSTTDARYDADNQEYVWDDADNVRWFYGDRVYVRLDMTVP